VQIGASAITVHAGHNAGVFELRNARGLERLVKSTFFVISLKNAGLAQWFSLESPVFPEPAAFNG
jgi:hypothetical protein